MIAVVVGSATGLIVSVKVAAELAAKLLVAPAVAVRSQVPAVRIVTRPLTAPTPQTPVVVLANVIVPLALPAANVW